MPGKSPDILSASDTTSENNSNMEQSGSDTAKLSSINSAMNTSIDSGIHDVVVKQEPMDDYVPQDASETAANENTLETDVTVKSEPVSDSETMNKMNNGDNDIGTETDLQLGGSKEGEFCVGVKESCNEDRVTQGEGSNAICSKVTTEVVGSEGNTKLDEGVNSSDKKMDVSEDVNNKDGTKDDDVVIVEGSLMEYRNIKKVIRIDGDTSDSSPDSSDSEDEAEGKKAENTDAQINKIMSNEREASPDRERRIKLNPHGFEDIRTKGEILPEELPPLEELTITVDESVQMQEVGTIKSIVGILVVIQSSEKVPALNDETILFVEGHKVLGQVFEVFGPVKTPWYSIRFNEASNIESKGLKVGMPVYCAPKEKSYTKFVFVDHLTSKKGSDASWEDNNEPPEKHLDYSDDESERRAKAKRRNKKLGENEGEGTDAGENTVQKKNPRRNRNKQQKDDQRQGTQPGGRKPWNPFQGNQMEGSNNPSPRYGSNHHNGVRHNHPEGQKWPQKQFNRPQSRFGGPPNFQNQPRPGNHGQQPFFQRNNQGNDRWQQPNNTNFTNGQQNYEYTASPLNTQSPHPGNSFNTPPPSMTPSSFSQNPPAGGMNIDISQPPPCFQFANQSRPQMPTGNWTQQPASMNQQNHQFVPNSNNQSMNTRSQSFGTGNQSVNNMPQSISVNQSTNCNQAVNTRNQIQNQGQTGFIPNQTNQLNTNVSQLPSQINNINPAFQGNNFQQNQNYHQAQTNGFGTLSQGGQGQNPVQGHNQIQNQGPSFANINSQQNLMQMGGVISGQFNGNQNLKNRQNLPASNIQQSIYGIQGQNQGLNQIQNMSGQNSFGNFQNQQMVGSLPNQSLISNTQGVIQQGMTQQSFQQNTGPTFGNNNQGYQGTMAVNQSVPQTDPLSTVPGGRLGPGPINTVTSQGRQTVVDHRFIQNTT